MRPARGLRVGVRALLAIACFTGAIVGAKADPLGLDDRPRGTPVARSVPLRVATFNVEDLRSDEIADPHSIRVKRLAAIIQAIRPDILLINEIQHDEPAPDHPGGQTARHFAESFLAVSQGDGLEPLRYNAFMAPSNTGQPSGLDLDNNGIVGEPGSGRDYGGDCLGYGEFPGQYAMALLVREGLAIEHDQIRTFRTFLWRDMPDALLPPALSESDPDAGWFSPEELAVLPLSSKSHWDVPVRLPNGAVIHILASHPTPPVFDGPEDRNGRRNHDEIRFWADYINDARYIVDDDRLRGGLRENAHFVILGDLNADPSKGDSRANPVGRFLLEHPKVNAEAVPRSLVAHDGLEPTDTSAFRLRVDYVLPSKGLDVTGLGVWRGPEDSPPGLLAQALAADGIAILAGVRLPSDHFPVWVDLAVPAPER